MPIYNYPSIKVSGQGNLKIYAIDYEVATIDNPGRATVTYVDVNNNLPTPRLTTLVSSVLTIGGMRYIGYPVKYKRTVSSSGQSLLIVTYIDGSFILDKYYIGLKGQHCNASTSFDNLYSSKIGSKGLTFNSLKTYHSSSAPINISTIPDWLIIVGTFIDPCKNKFSSSSNSDPCDPCPKGDNQQGNDSNSIDCEKKRSYDISKVDYSFSELISALKEKGLGISLNLTYNNNYRTSYSGSLREVLQSWCSDFGFSFYFYENKIYIYDLRTGVNLNPSLSESITTQISEESSIEHTKSTASMAYLAIPGVDKEYNCSAKYGNKIVCRALTLKDIGAKGLMDEYGATSENGLYELIELLAMMSGYSPVLRETVTWFDVYNIRTGASAKRLVDGTQTSSAINGISSRAGNYYSKALNDDKDNGNYTLPLLNMTIKAVYESSDPEFADIMASTNFNESMKKKALDPNYKPYFFIASQNETAFSNKTHWEQNIASDFLGKYFLRWYENYSTSSPSVSACQGDSAQFYKQGTNALNFSNFMPTFAIDTAELGYNQSKYIKPSNFSSLPIYKFSSEQNAGKDSFVLVNRNLKWQPPIQEGGEVKRAITLASNYRFTNLGLATSFLNFTNNHPNAKNDPVFGEQDFLFLAFELKSGLNTRIISGINHPEESQASNLCKMYKSEYGTPIDLGLGSTRTTRVSLGSVADFYFPPQSKVGDISNGGGYSVYVSHDRALDYSSTVPKLEIVECSFYQGQDVLRNELNYKTNMNLDGINPLTYKRIRDVYMCLPNFDEISNKMKSYVNNMKSIVAGESKSISFDIAGLPSVNYTPMNGLIGLSVRIGSKGVTSTLSFSDFKNRDIKQSETLKEFQEIKNEPLSNNALSHKISRNLLSSNLSENTLNL